MSIKLNQAAIDHAKYLIKAGEFESFDADWNEEMPTQTEINDYIDTHSMEEYSNWFLGRNEEFDSEDQEHYEYPFGDLKEVQRSALTHSLERAEKSGHKEIARAAKELLALIDNKSKQK